MNETIDELLMLLIETADYFRNDLQLSPLYQDIERNVLTLRRQMKICNRRYVVGLVGMTNVGKSTLLNAMFGAEIAPRRNGPCTAVPVEFEYADELVVQVYFHSKLGRPTWECETMNQVHERLSSLADDSGAEKSEMIKRIVVKCPNVLLKTGLVLGDTPGFGAAQLAAAAGSHEQSLKNYLHASVSRVFWVVMADQGIGATEKRFHDDFFADICNDIVVTGCEDWNDEDKKRFRKKYQTILQKPLLKFHFVSGRQGMLAREKNDCALYKQSGVEALEHEFALLGQEDNRLEILNRRLLDVCGDFVFWINDYVQTNRRPFNGWWRKDSWYRWQDAAPDDPFKKQIDDIFSQLK